MIKVSVSKGRDGFRAESQVALADFGLPGKFLQVSTGKTSSGKLTTSVSAVNITPEGYVTFLMFGDYRKTAKSVACRCTEKSVTAQQDEVLLVVPQYITEAVAYYAKDAQPA